MATLQDLEAALRNADAAGDEAAARILAAEVLKMRAPVSRGTEVPAPVKALGNFGAGLIRGAGSIGATLLTPYDLIAGNTKSIGNPERRRDMTQALQSLGADADSGAFAVGKIGGEVAGTLGAGGAVGSLLGRAAPALSTAMRTGGMAQVLPTRGADLAVRALGGATAGGAGAALINPEDAGAGAALGAVTPGLVQAAGAAGRGVGRMLRGPEQTPQMAQALREAQSLGLVVPPTQARASFGNRVLEGMAGKLTTAQNASAKNAEQINKIAARELGLPAGVDLTPDVIDKVKKAAGVLYEAVGNAGTVRPGPAYAKALDDIAAPHVKAAAGFPDAAPSPVIKLVDSLRSDAFDAASAVGKIKELRSMSSDAFRTGSADIGRAAKKAAMALEDTLDDHLKAIGEPDLLGQFRDARKLYAKASDVGDALTGANTVDARVLARKLEKGKPLSGDLKKLAEFSAQFKTATKPPEQMGSLPQFSPLDLFGSSMLGGGAGIATGNPLAMASGLAFPAARVGARSMALSPAVQRRLIQKPAIQGANALEALALSGRAAPLISTDQ